MALLAIPAIMASRFSVFNLAESFTCTHVQGQDTLGRRSFTRREKWISDRLGDRPFPHAAALVYFALVYNLTPKEDVT